MFFHKIYSTVEIIHKNTGLKEKMPYITWWIILDCMYSNKKRKCYQFHFNATSRKSQKLIPSKKNIFSNLNRKN